MAREILKRFIQDGINKAIDTATLARGGQVSLGDYDMPYGQMSQILAEVDFCTAPGEENLGKFIFKISVLSNYAGDKSRSEYLRERIEMEQGELRIGPVGSRYKACYWYQKGESKYFTYDEIKADISQMPIDEIAEKISNAWFSLR